VNVARVRAWRSHNPGYWRKRRVALQDLSLEQAVDSTNHSGERASGSAPLDIEPLERVSIDRTVQSVDLLVEALRKLHHSAVQDRHLMCQHAFNAVLQIGCFAD
jgi:hypothetical protein